LKKGGNYGIVSDMKVRGLRKKYPEFVYKGYSYGLKNGDLVISFDFRLGQTRFGPRFGPRVIVKNVPASNWLLSPAKQPILDNLVFHLGLAEIPSYWKATASPNIIIEAGHLNKTQINWWHDLFIKGMGQYFFENKIDFRVANFLQITTQNIRSAEFAIANKTGQSNKNVLVPIGGGKDAIVTYEILKAAKQNITPFVLNPTNAQTAILHKIGDGRIIVKRIIDPKLLKLNRKGFLNGHTPFSAYLAFLTTLCAALFDYKYIALSNEHSSNEGNVQYLGQEINHQYSKTFEFEKKFRSYSKKYLAQNIEYFSFLRPLCELQIAKLFARYPQYFATFLSCNEAHKTRSGKVRPSGKWCGTCSKCLFVFAALYPFVEQEQLVKIFGKNLFQHASLISLMEELTGERGFKPFECVGTTRESLVAFYLSLQKTHPPLPPLLQYFRQNIAKKHHTLPKESRALLGSWNKNHALPPHLEKALKSVVQ